MKNNQLFKLIVIFTALCTILTTPIVNVLEVSSISDKILASIYILLVLIFLIHFIYLLTRTDWNILLSENKTTIIKIDRIFTATFLVYDKKSSLALYVSMLLLMIGQKNQNMVYFLLLSLITFLLSIGINIDRNFKNNSLQKTTFIFNASIPLILGFWAKSISNSQVNNIFGVDSSYFPYTNYAMTVYNLAKYIFIITPPIYFLMLLIHKLILKRKVLLNNNPYIIISIIYFVFMFPLGIWMLGDGITNKSIIKIAIDNDFNTYNKCFPKLQNKHVVFMSNKINNVLYNTREINTNELPNDEVKLRELFTAGICL